MLLNKNSSYSDLLCEGKLKKYMSKQKLLLKNKCKLFLNNINNFKKIFENVEKLEYKSLEL